MMKTILVINGPNLNLLGSREPELYGNVSLEELNRELETVARKWGVNIEFYQSNHEGELIDCIHAAKGKADFLILNAGALTHYSIALHDALKAVRLPVIEVHLTNPYAREEFRHRSLVAPVAPGGVFGLGTLSYRLAVEAACFLLQERATDPHEA